MEFRTELPKTNIGKILRRQLRDESQKIEFLCDGQQCVVDGIHPDTSKPYAWPGKCLFDVLHEELPYIRGAEALKRFVPTEIIPPILAKMR